MIPDLKVKVTAEAKVSPSEAPEKVAEAVMSVMGGSPGELKRVGGDLRYLSEDVKSLSHLKDQLRDRKVRSVARRLLTGTREGNRTYLMVNRQAALAGVVALCGSPEESPLGPIVIRIESGRLEELIDWLTAYEDG